LIDNCTFKDNRVSTKKIEGKITPVGGAIVIMGACTQFTVKNTVFDHNSAYKGGAIYSNINVMWINLINDKFHNNTACFGGSIVITGETTLTVERCRFTYNRAVRRGGAIQILGLVQANFHQTTFNNNIVNQSSDCNGGVISVEYYSRLGFTSCNFENNFANLKGGIIYSLSVVNIRIVESNITNNTALIGSALHLDNFKNSSTFNNKIIFDETSFVNNNGKFIVYSFKQYNQKSNYNILRACWWGSNYVPNNVTHNFMILNYQLVTITLNDININTNWLKKDVSIVVNRTKNLDKNLIISTATIKENNTYRYPDAFLPTRKISIKENNNKVIYKNLYVYYHLNMNLNTIVINMDNQKITIKLFD
jgi:predicted outer membrane repeat protein